MATLVAPLISQLIGLCAGLLMILMFCVTLMFHGLMPWRILMQGHLLQTSFNVLALMPLYAIWALPTVGWLLMCSAWSRARPFLLAFVVPIGISLMLGWFHLIHVLNVSVGPTVKWLLTRLLTGVFPGGWLLDRHQLDPLPSATLNGSGTPLQLVQLSTHYAVFTHPTIWIGLLTGCLFIAIAIWCRRWRDDA